MPARAEGSCFALQVLSEQRQQLEQEQAEARMFSMCRKAVVTQTRLYKLDKQHLRTPGWGWCP